MINPQKNIGHSTINFLGICVSSFLTFSDLLERLPFLLTPACRSHWLSSTLHRLARCGQPGTGR